MYKTSSYYSDAKTVRNNFLGSKIHTALSLLTSLPEPKYNGMAFMIFEIIIRTAILMSNFYSKRKMKKFIITITVFALFGCVFTSCSVDAEELENSSKNQKVVLVPKQHKMLFSKEGDSISALPNYYLTEGPGDDPIVVPPSPKKINQ